MKILFEVLEKVYIPGILDETISYDGLCRITVRTEDYCKVNDNLRFGGTHVIFPILNSEYKSFPLDNKWNRKRYCPIFLQEVNNL